MLYLFISCSTTIDSTLSLIDTNTTSATFGQELALTDYEGTVSAWYFGHSS